MFESYHWCSRLHLINPLLAYVRPLWITSIFAVIHKHFNQRWIVVSGGIREAHLGQFGTHQLDVPCILELMLNREHEFQTPSRYTLSYWSHRMLTFQKRLISCSRKHQWKDLKKKQHILKFTPLRRPVAIWIQWLSGSRYT